MNIQGVGEIYEGNQKRAKVRYDLNIERGYFRTRTFDSSQVVEGLQSRSGSIYVLEGKIGLLDIGKNLTLYMDDGQKKDFLITDGDVNAGRFLILLS